MQHNTQLLSQIITCSIHKFTFPCAWLDGG